ncbi:hypothetical protein SG35_023545 [Thalassomonas actiniarum]|uniref:Uncharacterized protein n=1 Tax=Thalassomonas actiniarum TaxID=485447 RepID=A0AAE9YPP5_9GAMM|nr:hypothetical protein SG35_023545 [Thalassomonas actiniarum]
MSNSTKGKRLLKIEALPCVNGHLPKVKMINNNSYLMVCQKPQCNCPGPKGMTPQKSYREALLEWNKFTPVHTIDDLYHPTVRVKGLPLKAARLNLTVEWMFINKFLSSFSRDDLMADDREVFIVREKWLELLRHQLSLLEAARANKTHKPKVTNLPEKARQKQCRATPGPIPSKACG